MGAAVPADAGTRFAAALDRLVPEGDLGLAVSGGPDSLALLILAARERAGRFRVATVDHGLRTEAADEVEQVAACCRQLSIPHHVLKVRVETGASLQAQARHARYAALGKWADGEGLNAVATAHHADDQAETLLMRLARGSGVGGLGGIREERPLHGDIRLIRPLLSFRKRDLEAIVEEMGWAAADDPSNRDPRHDRTRARDLLASNPWLDPERLARSAGALREADETLKAICDEEWQTAVIREGEAFVYRPSTLSEMQRRTSRRLLQELAPGAEIRGPELDRLLQTLERGGQASLAGVLVSARDGAWHFRPAPPRKN